MGPVARRMASADEATRLLACSRFTGIPPSQRITGPSGPLNRLCLPIQYTRRRSTKASISVYGKSQLLVWGAAISTLLVALSGNWPSTVHPVRRKVIRENARRKVLTTGVSKMVRCMGRGEEDARTGGGEKSNRNVSLHFAQKIKKPRQEMQKMNPAHVRYQIELGPSPQAARWASPLHDAFRAPMG